MQCGEAKKHLYLLRLARQSGSEPAVFPRAAEALQAEAHLSHCPDCREFLAAEERMKKLVQTHAPRESASATLREQVFARIAQERERSVKAARWRGLLRRRSLALALLSFVLIVALVGGLWLKGRRTPIMTPPIASVLIEDHAHSLPVVTEVASSDNGVVQSWFQGRVGFSFRLPPLNDSGLVGGRLCNLQGRRAALVIYQQPQSRVSLFILDGRDVEWPESNLIALDGKRCLVEAQQGYNAVLWKERGLLYGLVSDLRSADLLQLAARF